MRCCNTDGTTSHLTKLPPKSASKSLVMAATVRVVHQPRLWFLAPIRRTQCIHHQCFRHTAVHCPADDFTGVQILDRGQITSDLAGVVCPLSRMAITNDLPSVFCWVSQMAS